MFSVRCISKNFVKIKLRDLSKRTLVNNISSNFIVHSEKPDVEIPNINLNEYLTSLQTKFENYVAIECGETQKKYTFGDIRDKSSNLSKSLRKILKLEEGDVVAIVLRNNPEYPVANFGVMKANLIVTPVSPAFTADEISRQLIDSGAKAVITDVELYAVVRSAILIAKKTLPTLVVKNRNDQSLPENTINFHEFVDAKVDYPEIRQCDPSAVALMAYSSGTTGLPKGVELTHRNLVAQGVQSYTCDGEFIFESTNNDQEILPTILPYYHIFGQAILIGLHAFGCKMISIPTFTPEMYISVLKNSKSTILYLVPSLVLMLTYHDAVKSEYLKHVRAILSGGAPLAASDEKQFEKKFGEKLFLQGYGMTEASPTVTSLYPSILENPNSYKGSIGRPLPNTLTKIVGLEDKTYTALGPNQTGELLIKGPQVMKGYHNLPEETKNIMTDDGWLKSGDLGYYNEDGFLFITDRLKELIKVKGNQVAPAELEGVIRSFPGVVDAAVIGVPHEKSGEVPRAYIVAEKGFNTDKLNEFVNEKVARYKQLKGGIEVVETIPKNAAGKILRRELKQMYLK